VLINIHIETIDRFEWNTYNEGCDLPMQVRYKELNGHYLELVCIASMSIGTPTGDDITKPSHFVRPLHCSLVGYFRLA